MKNSADLRGCYPPWPLASVDSTFLDLQHSSYPTQPHSIIAKFLSVLSQCNTELIKLLHLLYVIEVKTIKHAFSMFYTLMKHGFLTSHSTYRFLSTLQINLLHNRRIIRWIIIWNLKFDAQKHRCYFQPRYTFTFYYPNHYVWNFYQKPSFLFVCLFVCFFDEREIGDVETESARSSSNKWTKTLYQDYLRCIANFCRAFLNIFSKQLILATPNVENKCWTSYETLESFGEMKLIMKFCLCFHKIAELWNLFSLIPVGNYFSVLFQAII